MNFSHSLSHIPTDRSISAETLWQPFPIDVFRDTTGSFIRETAGAIGIDPAFIAPPVLSALSGLIGRSCCIELKRGYSEIPSIWTLTLAPSGSGKSPGIDAAIAPIRKCQQLEDERYKKKRLEYEGKMREYGRQQDGGSEKRPTAPVPQQLLIDDATTEAVAEILADNPSGCLLFQDELAGFLGSFDAYRSGGGGKDLSFWLSLFDGTPVRINRKTGNKLITAPTPAIAICGGIQPGMIHRILAKNPHFFDAGLIARFLITCPPPLPIMWTEREVSEQTEQGYKHIVQQLLGLRRMVSPEQPIVLTLSNDAKKIWEEFFNGNAAGQYTRDTEAERAALAKMSKYAARIALVLHVIENLESGMYNASTLEQRGISREVSAQTLRSAIRLIEWFKTESMRLLASFRSPPPRADRRTMAIIDLIHNRGSIEKSDLHSLRVFRNAEMPSVMIDAALSELRHQGVIESEYVKNPRGGAGKERFRFPTFAGSGSETIENTGK